MLLDIVQATTQSADIWTFDIELHGIHDCNSRASKKSNSPPFEVEWKVYIVPWSPSNLPCSRIFKASLLYSVAGHSTASLNLNIKSAIKTPAINNPSLWFLQLSVHRRSCLSPSTRINLTLTPSLVIVSYEYSHEGSFTAKHDPLFQSKFLLSMNQTSATDCKDMSLEMTRKFQVKTYREESSWSHIRPLGKFPSCSPSSFKCTSVKI